MYSIMLCNEGIMLCNEGIMLCNEGIIMLCNEGIIMLCNECTVSCCVMKVSYCAIKVSCCTVSSFIRQMKGSRYPGNDQVTLCMKWYKIGLLDTQVTPVWKNDLIYNLYDNVLNSPLFDKDISTITLSNDNKSYLQHTPLRQ